MKSSSGKAKTKKSLKVRRSISIATSVKGNGGEKLVIKIICNEDAKEGNLDSIQNEIETLYQLNHPNIITLYHAYTDEVFTYIVLEHCAVDIIDIVPEDKARVLASKLLSALAYLHQKRLCHLDIKPQNVMLKTNDPSDLRLIDFGYAYDMNDVSQFIPRGTKEYYAPEIAEGLAGTFSDMWSFGITLYYWLSLSVPFKGANIEEIVARAIYRKIDLDTDMYLLSN